MVKNACGATGQYSNGTDNLRLKEARAMMALSDAEIALSLGAEVNKISTNVLTVYIPNKDRHNVEIGTQRKWLLEAGQLLAQIGGGFTIMPPAEGGWIDYESTTREVLWENPVVIFTYVDPSKLMSCLPLLREFLHRMGRETRQGEVVVEYDHRFYRIRSFDSPDLQPARDASTTNDVPIENHQLSADTKSDAATGESPEVHYVVPPPRH